MVEKPVIGRREMALKLKAPFGPGVRQRTQLRNQVRALERSGRKRGLVLKVLKSGNLGLSIPKKGKTVKTPRRTSRGVSF